ncbi:MULTISPECIES: helix-turn-helix transcriptional regulator [Burkholderia cepacia complex]|uniref:helix-turn-helix transcriptional regulator n=1 Tax=Burkholderia cepacia complex TaxID=87882 RepID=UPI00157A5361|nr:MULTISPECIES: AraC family transcriptional regulator [Burkholderia cepacia complex]NTY35959.1 AraC family transcriptional regulator [Burkholderia diffusa]
MNDLLARPGMPPLTFPPLLSDNDIPRSAMLFVSDDLEHVRREVSKVYRPHRFSAARHRATPATMFNLDGDNVALSWFAYGTDIAISPEIFGNFVLVLTTLAGHSDIRSGALAHAGGSGSTVLVASDEQARFRYSEDNVQMGVRIDARRIAEIWRRVSGREPPSVLPSCALLDTQRRNRWLASVQMLRHLLDPDTPPALKAMQLPLVEELLIMSLVGEQLADAAPARERVAPACVKRAIAYIDAHAGQPLALSDIAAAAHCSVRTLQRAFQQWRDIGTMRYLKEVRLQRVRTALQAPDDAASITEIATRWGFGHLGQFAADYRRMFGERPSETRSKR